MTTVLLCSQQPKHGEVLGYIQVLNNAFHQLGKVMARNIQGKRFECEFKEVIETSNEKFIFGLEMIINRDLGNRCDVSNLIHTRKFKSALTKLFKRSLKDAFVFGAPI